MEKLSEAIHAIKQIDYDGVMIGISREWYEKAKEKLAAYENTGLEPAEIIILATNQIDTAKCNIDLRREIRKLKAENEELKLKLNNAYKRIQSFSEGCENLQKAVKFEQEQINVLKSDNEAKDKRIEVLKETLKIAIKNWSYYSMDDLIKLAEEALKERK